MTNEKILDVLNIYEARLRLSEGPFVEHLREMIPKVRVFIEEGRRDKVFRWLGFMQGAMWMLGIYSIDEMKAHNAPPGAVLETTGL